MLRIAIYVSEHGFGHATRMSALATEFSRFGIYTFVRSTKPDYLFVGQDSCYYRKHDCTIDTGVKHDIGLTTNLDATWVAIRDTFSRRSEIVDQEVEFLRNEGIDLVVADIPYLISEACGYAGIPVIAISNFDWFFIYKRLFYNRPETRPVLNTIFGLYRRMDSALILPFSDRSSMSAFTRTRRTGLLARKKDHYNDIHSLLHIPTNEPVLACTFGGEGEMQVSLENLCAAFNGIVISRGDCSAQNHRKVDREADWLDITHGSEIILTKPGYSTFAEAVQTGKFIVYCPRFSYPEEEPLITGLANYPNKIQLHNLNLSIAEWKSTLRTPMNPKRIPRKFSNQNSEVAADILAEYLRITRSGHSLASVFDIGSNNLNYVLWDKTDEKLIHTSQMTTGLGSDIPIGASQYPLPRKSMLSFMKAMRKVLAWENGIQPSRSVVCASVARRTSNLSVIDAWVTKATGCKVKVLSEKSESRLAWLAANNIIVVEKRLLVVDIGGQSTEFIWGIRNDEYRSVPVGLLTFLNGTKHEYFDDPLNTLASIADIDDRQIVCVGLTGAYLARYIKHLGDVPLQWTHGMGVTVDELREAMVLSSKITYLYTSDVTMFETTHIVDTSIKMMLQILDRLRASNFLVCYYGISLGFIYDSKSKSRYP